MRRVVGIRAGVVVAALAIVAAIAVGVAHESSNTQHRTPGTSGSQSASESAPRVITPPKPNELGGVLADWTDANPHASAVVGVQVGSRTAVFSSSAGLTDTTSFRLAVPGIAGSATTPDALMQFATDFLRAHAQGAHDLASSYFRIGRDGRGRGVEGFTSDGFCARAPHGCAPGTTFFAVGVVGSGPGGAAEVVYDPRADVGIVAVSRAQHADLTGLVERAFLLTTLGRAGYERAVSNTARVAAPSVTHQ